MHRLPHNMHSPGGGAASAATSFLLCSTSRLVAVAQAATHSQQMMPAGPAGPFPGQHLGGMPGGMGPAGHLNGVGALGGGAPGMAHGGMPGLLNNGLGGLEAQAAYQAAYQVPPWPSQCKHLRPVPARSACSILPTAHGRGPGAMLRRVRAVLTCRTCIRRHGATWLSSRIVPQLMLPKSLKRFFFYISFIIEKQSSNVYLIDNFENLAYTHEIILYTEKRF